MVLHGGYMYETIVKWNSHAQKQCPRCYWQSRSVPSFFLPDLAWTYCSTEEAAIVTADISPPHSFHCSISMFSFPSKLCCRIFWQMQQGGGNMGGIVTKAAFPLERKLHLHEGGCWQHPAVSSLEIAELDYHHCQKDWMNLLTNCPYWHLLKS